jgi:flagellar hook-associated protein 1 FlgK
MAGLYDIAASGISAYRNALSVTGQNIANINTEGYRRREATLQEVSASQSGIYTRADQTGLGVRVEDIRRAFDAFLATRVRDTSADFVSADTYKTTLDQLEGLLLPEDYDLGFFITDFFSGVSGVAQSPGDLAPRVALIEQGRALAGAFGQASSTLEWLRESVIDQARIAATEFNTTLEGLLNVQGRLISAGQSGQAANALLDERDKIVKSLNETARMSVDYGSRGDVTLTFGPAGAGRPVLQGLESGTLAVAQSQDRLVLLSGWQGRQIETTQIGSGRIAGLVAAYETITATMADLDALAVKLAADLNAVHGAGLTLDGTRGGPLFTADATTIAGDPKNLGTAAATLTAPQVMTGERPDLRIVYDAAADLWRGFDPSGQERVSGREVLNYGDIEIGLAGRAADRDTFYLTLSRGKAANMRFLADRPQAIAAGAPSLASKADTNLGTADLTATIDTSIEPPDLRRIETILRNDGAALTATRLRSEGVVGHIPAGTRAIDLYSLAQQDSLSFTVTDGALGTLGAVSVSVGGISRSFDLGSSSAWSQLRSRNPDADMSDLAEMLNEGTILGTGGASFAALGIHASGEGGILTIAGEAGSLGAGSIAITGSVAVAGTLITGNATPSTVQVFTREGRHVAGTPLAQSELVGLLTEENGFMPQAEYRADWLNGAGGVGYLGLRVTQSIPTGEQVLRLSGAEVQGALADGAVTFKAGTDTETIQIAPAASAEALAALVNARTADTGVHASARTRLELSFGTAGSYSAAFTLQGTNATPVVIEIATAPTHFGALRDAINNRAGQTGITAATSPDGQRLVLESATGADIVIGDFTATGGAIAHREVSETFAGSTPSAFAAGQTLRQKGAIALRAASSTAGFVGIDAHASASDAFTGGILSRSVSAAGERQDIAFGIVEGIDTNEAARDGLSASAAAGSYSLTVGGRSATVSAAALTDPSSAGVAAALAAALRASAPVPALTGATVGALPSDGASVAVMLGSQRYTLTMRGSEVRVDGPEAGRVVAGFVPVAGGFALKLETLDGLLTGQSLRLEPTADPAAATAFGLGTGTTTQAASVTGRAFAALTAPATVQIAVNGTTHTVTVDATTHNVSAAPTLPAGVAIAVNTPSAGMRALVITLTGAAAAQPFRILPPGNAALGLETANAQLTVTPAGLRAESVDGQPVAISGSAESLAGQRITLGNLPDEDLIVVMTGAGGARRLTARYDIAPKPPAPPLPPAVEVRVLDAAQRRVEIIDRASGQAIASRTVDADGLITAAGFRFVIDGTITSGDRFFVSPNAGGIGDARNIAALLKLENADPTTGRGGFQDVFRALVTDVGGQVRTATISAASAEALRDGAAEVESGFAGVNLDSEAAQLLQQQQVYQALARVMTTARDLLDTLLRSI